MNSADTFVLILVCLLAGMLMAFGIVLVFVFLGSSDSCRTTLYSFLPLIS